MRLYFMTSKQETRYSVVERCVHTIQRKFPDADVTWSEDINWPAFLRQHSDDWDAVYAKILSEFDVFVVLPHYEYLGKGNYDLCSLVLESGKPLWACDLSSDGIEIRAVRAVELTGEDNWKFRYGRVLMEQL